MAILRSQEPKSIPTLALIVSLRSLAPAAWDTQVNGCAVINAFDERPRFEADMMRRLDNNIAAFFYRTGALLKTLFGVYDGPCETPLEA
jgi:hypothetical protein